MLMSVAYALLHEPKAVEGETSGASSQASTHRKGRRPPKPIKDMSMEEYEAWYRSNGL